MFNFRKSKPTKHEVGVESAQMLHRGQRTLRGVNSDGIGVILLPFADNSIGFADNLTESARCVPQCAVRDFGFGLISAYQQSAGKTLFRLISRSQLLDLEAYTILSVDLNNRRHGEEMYCVGVATITRGRIVPANASLEDGLVEHLGLDADDKLQEAVVATFWNGEPKGIIETDRDRSDIGAQVSQLLVPRTVEIARAECRTACTFVASEASGEPDQTSAMRKRIRKVATGKWLSPVHSPEVDYDLLVA